MSSRQESIVDDSVCQGIKETAVTLTGKELTIENVVEIARYGYPVELTDDALVYKKMKDSCDFVKNAVSAGRPLYGVNTLFGGMAHSYVLAKHESTCELQNNLLYFLKTGTGAYLPSEDVRAAMLLRANSHLIGASGIRMEIVSRLLTYINKQITPLVPEFGSIGASGDLIPLAYIGGSICGTNETFLVDYRGKTINAVQALEHAKLEKISLLPKEGLAMTNGTSVMTASATIAIHDSLILFAATLRMHAMAMQAMLSDVQPFYPFIHQLKPHAGQQLVARTMLDLLSGSKMINDCSIEIHPNVLIQNRYSVRCIPQYLGPFIEAIHDIRRIVEIEINSANDNPLIDGENQKAYVGGNFLGEHISTSMDRLRYTIGLISKHIDVQIAQVVMPEFSNGLPGCLIGNREREANMGVKGLQLCGNSIMPYLLFLGNSIADKYATHAEQYNQNINSLGQMSALLARRSTMILQQHIAVGFLIFVQGLDLRSKLIQNTYDPRKLLSTPILKTYDAIRELIQVPILNEKPYIWNDNEQSLDKHIQLVADNITNKHSSLYQSLQPTIESLKN
ncbi:unnamed protein product [Didymodactylos carnosus]|uniref:Phenylalanine ammonia-lyase n=1 Tax=Didymodactylos carnosus TaxID=1234261 RepID=A0A814Z869_9BILA|nr:unnamed protein product [Didymodactylos carnosus]CAF4003125.1 unnamed protein product [Didymodactylos carnosus]